MTSAPSASVVNPGPQPELSLEPPDDTDAYLIETYRNFLQAPAFDMTALKQGEFRELWADGKGAVRVSMPSLGITLVMTPEHELELIDEPGGRHVAIDVGPPINAPDWWIGTFSVLEPTCGQTDGKWQCFDPDCRTAYAGLGEAIGRPVHRISCGETTIMMLITLPSEA